MLWIVVALFVVGVTDICGQSVHPRHHRSHTLDSVDSDARFPHHLWPAEDITEPCDPALLPSSGLWTEDADPRGRRLVGTAFAQSYIWHRQHDDVDCATAKAAVLDFPGRNNGIGSMLHLIGVGLAVALQHRRVFLLGPGTFLPTWKSGPLCRGVDSLDHCWFRPLAKCTLRDFHDGLDSTYVDTSRWQLPWPKLTNMSRSPLRVVVVPQALIQETRTRLTVPDVFHDLLTKAGIPRGRWYYWWRAQAAAYVVRFDPSVAARLQRRMRRIYPHGPIPRGTISVHVRRGDKVLEAELRSDQEFLAAAQWVAAHTPARAAAGGGGGIFLSTEDSQTAAFFKQEQSQFNATMTQVARYHDETIRIVAEAMSRGVDSEMADAFVSLNLALHCDAFVGDMSSNWVRLIDELRSTVRCRAHVPFRDPGRNSTDFFYW